MYKVEVYKFHSKTTDSFTEGHLYYLRNSKDGVKRFLSTDDPSIEWQIANGGISLAASYNTTYLRDNFIPIRYITFKNFRDFKEHSVTLKALEEVEKIESGELPRKSAREFLKESRKEYGNNS